MSLFSFYRLPMRKLIKFAVVWMSFLFVWASSQTGRAAVLSFDGEPIDVQNSIRILEDRGGDLSASDALRHLKDFTRPDVNDLAKGYSGSVYWAHLEIKNNSKTSELKLAAVYPVVELETYRIDPSERTGLALEARLEGRREGAKLTIPSNASRSYLVRMKSSQFLNLSLTLKEEHQLVDQEHLENMLLSLLFGIFFAAFIFNFLMFLVIRQRGYLYYLLFSIVNCHLAFLAIKFPSSILRWGGLDWDFLVHPYSTVGAFTTFLFVRNFLGTQKEFPRLDAAMQIYMAGIVAIFLTECLAFSPTQATFADQYYPLGVVLLGIAGVRSFIRGFHPARYYLMALIVFLLGIVTFLALAAGLVPMNTFTLNALLIGQIGEMLLMSIALSSKLKLIEQESTRSLFKTQILRQISHDLINSLSIIKMSAEYADSIGIEKSRGQVLRAAASIEEIVKQVQDQNLAQLSEVKKSSTASVEDVFDDLCFAYEGRAQLKGIKIVFQILEPNLKMNVSRSVLSQQILGNIVSNAIKFSDLGGTIEVTAESRGLQQVRVSVRDHGRGIPRRLIPEMMRDDSDIRSQKGTVGEKGLGIGLSIVKSCLKDYRGALKIKSELKTESSQDHGTTITVLLRRRREGNLIQAFIQSLRQGLKRLKVAVLQARA
jgi:signal transduction histidine kinase